MTDAERLGNNIRNCRELFGESQEELAEILGISKQAVSAYELGNTFPKKDNVFKIAQHFMVTADELMYTNLSENEILKNISYEISFFVKKLYMCYFLFSAKRKL